MVRLWPQHTWFRKPPIPSVVAVLLIAVAFLGQGSAAGAAPTRSSDCAWHKLDNAFFPDDGASYWFTTVFIGHGDHRELVGEGTFPFARYASLTTYDSRTPVDALTDHQIEPLPGHYNPFRPGEPPPEPADRDYEFLVSRPGSGAANELAVGNGRIVTLVYRVYLADDPEDPTGGVRLPSLKWRYPNGNEQALPPCNDPLATPAATNPFAPLAASVPQLGTEYLLVPEVELFPNPDNAYLQMTTLLAPEELLIVRALAPIAPDTRAGEPVTIPNDLRYWSFCQNKLSGAAIACTYDADVPTDEDGYMSIVISRAQDRPYNSEPADGVAWLDWGTEPVGNNLYRHLLPSAGFEGAIQRIDPGELPSESMGPYYPVVTRCSVGIFESGGPGGGVDACGANPAGA